MLNINYLRFSQQSTIRCHLAGPQQTGLRHRSNQLQRERRGSASCHHNRRIPSCDCGSRAARELSCRERRFEGYQKLAGILWGRDRKIRGKFAAFWRANRADAGHETTCCGSAALLWQAVLYLHFRHDGAPETLRHYNASRLCLRDWTSFYDRH